MDKRRRASISSRNLVDSVLRVESMSLAERERLAVEVHARQPNLFYSVLVLQRYGATLVQIEVVLNLLLVFHEAMKISGSSWPVVCEDVQERCLKRVSGRARFIEGLSWSVVNPLLTRSKSVTPPEIVPCLLVQRRSLSVILRRYK